MARRWSPTSRGGGGGGGLGALQTGDAEHVVPRLCLWMVGFAFATAITRILSRIWIFNAARAVEYDLRSDLFGHLLRLDGPYHASHPTGDTMSRLTNDVPTCARCGAPGSGASCRICR